jgi:hypothetical protein
MKRREERSYRLTVRIEPAMRRTDSLRGVAVARGVVGDREPGRERA